MTAGGRMEKPRVVVIAGRSVENYEKAGHAIPKGFGVQPCRGCGTPTVISPRGLEQAQKYGVEVLLVCNPCALEIPPDRLLGTLLTPHVAEQVERSGSAREQLSRFLDKFGGGK